MCLDGESLLSCHEVQEDARETRPCRMERQTLRLVSLYPKVAIMGEPPCVSQAAHRLPVFLLAKGGGRGLGWRGRSAFLVQYCHQEEMLLQIWQTLYHHFLGRSDKGVRHGRRTVSLGGEEVH